MGSNVPGKTAKAIPLAYSEPQLVPPAIVLHESANVLAVARAKGFTGNVCTHCGSSEMKISGHCEVCTSCGESSGCS